MRTTIATALALTPTLAITAPALAQTVGVTFDIDRPVLEPGESTTVRLLANFPADDFAFASAQLDVLADAGGLDITGSWSDLSVLPPMDAGPPSGRVTDRGIEGILAGQLSFPAAGIYADPTNPIAFYEFTFFADPALGGGYRVDLTTLTDRFLVYADRESAETTSYLNILSEGAASITVVPAPAGAFVLALGLAAGRRRR